MSRNENGVRIVDGRLNLRVHGSSFLCLENNIIHEEDKEKEKNIPEVVGE